MKGFDNNEMSVRTLQNLKNSLDNRIHEIYNQGYREGYKDGVRDAMQKMADRKTEPTEREGEQMIPEREREALMRLTMCAREECGMCKYKDTCDFDFQCETATRCMNILADALRKTEPNCSEKPNNCEDEPMKTADYCDICKRDMCEVCVADATNPYCVPSHYEIRHEPQPRCPKCGKRGYIRSLESMGVKLKHFDEYKWKCTNCNKYFKEEPKT